MNPQILYEDSNLIAVNKPAGLSVHGDGYSTEPTLVDWLKENFPGNLAEGEPLVNQKGELAEKPGIVHRLDKDTSGVLIVAKNQSTYLMLKEQFKNHTVKKVYKLLVYGEFKQAEGTLETIDLPIGRSKKDPRIRIARLKSPSKLREAITDYKIIEKFKDYTYIEAYPKTGRTHQIRVHFKAINHPLVCDSLYAPNMPCLPALSRQALHSASIEFLTPDGKVLRIEAPLPRDFETALESLKSLC